MAKLSQNSSTTTQPKQRKSYLLSVTPVEYSLTEGTDIPAPEHSPTRSQKTQDIAPPPTPGRGPLNSHPTTPDDASEMQLDPPAPTASRGQENSAPAPPMSSDGDAGSGSGQFKMPGSPASAAQNANQEYGSPRPGGGRRSSTGVRKLLSLSNLRSSFSSSRTSLAIPRSSNENQNQNPYAPSTYAPSTYNPSLKRPSSPSMASTTASTINPSSPQQHHQPPNQLRAKKSGGNWFKRKSGLFLLNNQTHHELDAVDEDAAYRPETGESNNKRIKPSAVAERERVTGSGERKRSPPPMIPEVGRGSFSGGDLGWDEGAFRR